MAVRVTEANLESKVLASDVPVLADFYSDGCLPCKRVSPVLAELEREGRCKVVKINAQATPALAERFSVRSVPTVVFFSGGKERARKAGVAGKEELKTILEQILEEAT